MTKELPLCKCGCGKFVTKKGNIWISGHNSRGYNNPAKLPGVGKKISDALKGIPKSDAYKATMSKLRKGVPKSDAAKLALSKAKKGIPLSDANKKGISKALTGIPHSKDRKVAISEGMKKSPSVSKMRGGDDICDHHYIYDHANPSLYTTKVTRKKHTQIHGWLRRSGIVVPHINEDAGQWKYK